MTSARRRVTRADDGADETGYPRKAIGSLSPPQAIYEVWFSTAIGNQLTPSKALEAAPQGSGPHKRTNHQPQG